MKDTSRQVIKLYGRLSTSATEQGISENGGRYFDSSARIEANVLLKGI